jgi:hypothetical protein
LDNLEKFLEAWITDLNIPNDINQAPRCPYAKSVWDNNRAKIVKCSNYNLSQFWAAVAEECEGFNTHNNITIVATDTIYDVHDVITGIDALNIYLNVHNKDLWLLQSCNELYSMVFIQKITELDDASKVLEKTAYYDQMRPTNFSKFVTYRRILRNNLRKEEND